MGKRLQRVVLSFFAVTACFVFSACSGGSWSEENNTPPPVVSIPITNSELLGLFKGGSSEAGFSGIDAYIDTRVVFNAIDVFLGLPLDAAVRDIISGNFTQFLQGTAPGAFVSGTAPYPAGFEVDAALKSVTAGLSEVSAGQKTADITLRWLFSDGSVTRTYRKEFVEGPFKGSVYSSSASYTYSAGTGLTTVSFSESADESRLTESQNSQTLKAAYSGTASFVRNSTDSTVTSLKNAAFSQSHAEADSGASSSATLDGAAVMTGTSATAGDLAGDLSFNGTYSFTIPSYKNVTGTVGMTHGTYRRGYDSVAGRYFNRNDITNSTLQMSSPVDYSSFVVVTNSTEMQGDWLGSFTDSCATYKGPGKMAMSIVALKGSWWGMSVDSSRFYGAGLSMQGTTVRFKNNSFDWGISSTATASTLVGDWYFDGCSGTFTLVKQ